MNEVDDGFKVRVEYIDVLSPHLGEVRALWRSNSITLGFLPDGAFADHARRRQILVALDRKDRCVGYLLYYSPLRPAFRDVTITHLCVDKIYRRRGVATVLINHLKNRTKHCGGIRLRCCRDYEANALWPRLGFTAEDEILGSSGRVLTGWRFDHGHPSLLTGVMRKKIQSKLIAVLDACVFYDLQDDPKPSSEESQSLLADWLQIDVGSIGSGSIGSSLVNEQPLWLDYPHGTAFANRVSWCGLPCDRSRQREAGHLPGR